MRFVHLHTIHIVPKTTLFPKYNISKHYRTRVNAVKCDGEKTIRKIRNKMLTSTVYISNVDCEAIRARIA